MRPPIFTISTGFGDPDEQRQGAEDQQDAKDPRPAPVGREVFGIDVPIDSEKIGQQSAGSGRRGEEGRIEHRERADHQKPA